jgi:hypothetical protein
MRNFLMVIVAVLMSWMHSAQAQPLTVDPETIVPLPDKFDMETPAPDVPPNCPLSGRVDRNLARR